MKRKIKIGFIGTVSSLLFVIVVLIAMYTDRISIGESLICSILLLICMKMDDKREVK